MPFEIISAVRANVRPLIGVCGKSGSGKTKSALLLARGLVGPKGRIVGVDTESRRMCDFAGRFDGDPECEIPGSFKVIEFDPPFDPNRCREALEAASKQADVVVWDSASHEWAGEGGCLQMVEEYLDQKAGDDYQKRDKIKASAWAKIGLSHAWLFNCIARFPVPLILCFRTKDKLKIEQTVNQQGYKKTEFKTEEDSPITRKDLIFEMKLSFLVEEREDGGGYWKFIKRGTSTLERMIVDVKQDRLSVSHGAAIALWCAAGAVPSSAAPAVPLRPLPPAPAVAPSSTKAKLSDSEKVQKWKARCIQAAAGDERYAIEMAVDAGILLPNEGLLDWPVDKLPKTKEQVDAMLDAISDKAGIPKNPEEIVP